MQRDPTHQTRIETRCSNNSDSHDLTRPLEPVPQRESRANQPGFVVSTVNHGMDPLPPPLPAEVAGQRIRLVCTCGQRPSPVRPSPVQKDIVDRGSGSAYELATTYAALGQSD